MVDIKISELSNVSSSQLTDLFEISRNLGGGAFESYSIAYHDLLHSVVGQNVITVGSAGAMQTTIEAGVAHALEKSPSITNPITVLVQPGNYTENPIVIPSYVSIAGVDGSKTTLVEASNPNNIMFTMSLNSALNGIRLSGASGANGVAIKSVAGSSESILIDISVRNCMKAFYSSGAGSAMRCYQCSLLTTAGNTNYGALADNGGVLLMATSVIRTAGSGTMDFGICSIGDNSKVILPTCQLTGLETALCANDGGLIDADSLFIKNCTNALQIGSSGSNSRIKAFAASIENSINYDVLIESVTGDINFTGEMNYSKRSIVSGASFDSIGIDEFNDSMKITGEVNIEEKTDIGIPGNTTLGAQVGLDVGEGGSYTFDEQGNNIVEYWQYDASAASGSRFTRYANNAGTQLTDNGDAIIVGSKFPFSAIRLDVNTAANLGGNSIITEHWNGITWTEDTICGYEKSNMAHRGNVIFQDVETQYVEAGTIINSDWVSDDNVLDSIPDWDIGFDMYPIRFRTNGGSLVTGMEFDSGKVRGDDFDVTEAQVTVNWGRYRGTETLVVPSYQMNPNTVNPPSNTTITFSPNVTTDAQAQFADGNLAATTYRQIIPDWADTSSGINLTVMMCPLNSNTGNVNIVVRYVPLGGGLVLDGTAPEYSASLIATTPGITKSIFATACLFNISGFNPGQGFIISLERDATGTNPLDTYVGDIVIIGATMTWTRKIIG